MMVPPVMPIKLIKPHQLFYIASILTVIAVLSLSVWVNYGMGYFNFFESERYIPFYLGPDPLIVKIFDYRQTDVFQIWRARDLSAVFNYLDAQIILLSAKLGFPHFLSGIYYLSLFILVMVQFAVSRQFFPRRVFPVAGLMGTMYLFSAPVFLSGWYFRTSKIIVSLGISLAAYMLFALGKKPGAGKSGTVVTFIGFGLYAFLMAQIDELGLAFSSLLLGFLVALAILRRSTAYLAGSAGVAAGLLATVGYRTVVGPILVSRILGVKPQLYEAINPSFITWNTFMVSVSQVDMYFRIFAGNIPEPYSVVIYVAMFFIFYLAVVASGLAGRSIPVRLFLAGSMTAATIGFILAVFFLMAARVEILAASVFWLQLIPVPFFTLLYVMLSISLLAVTARFRPAYFVILIILPFLVAANALAVSHYRDALMQTLWSGQYYGITPAMIYGIRHPNIPAESLTRCPETVRIIRQRIYGNLLP